MPRSKTKIFISRKEEDWAIGRRIEKILSLYGADRLHFESSRQIAEGTKWREAIANKLKEADILFLLFTDPSAKWDWCLFEVGLFMPLGKRKQRPVICWHTAKTLPPGPLQDLRSVQTEPQEMKDFLRKFFGTSEITGKPPINKSFAENDEKLSEVAEQLCSELQSVSEPEGRFHYNRRLKITLDPAKLEEHAIPQDALIEADEMTLEIFGLLRDPPDGNWQWAKLESQMAGKGDDSWIPELADAICAACESHALQPIENTLRSLTSQKIYRPNVSWRDKKTDGMVTLEVLFIQQPAEGAQNVTYPATESGRRAVDVRP